MKHCSLSFATVIAVALASIQPAVAATNEDLARAERLRSFDDRTLGGIVFPHWLPDGIRFAYLSRSAKEGAGTVFLVDPRSRSKRPLISAAALAKALGGASNSAIDADTLPGWQVIGDGEALLTLAEGRTYRCTVKPVACGPVEGVVTTAGLAPSWASRSPDGKWDAFVWNYNLYIRPATAPFDMEGGLQPIAQDGDGNSRFGLYGDYFGFQPTGQREGCDWPAPAGPIDARPAPYEAPPSGSIQLTRDGNRLYSYGPRWKLGAEPATLDADRYKPTKAAITWSPDSKRLVVRRQSIRGLGTYPLYSSTSDQPVDHSYLYAAPGAKTIPNYDLYIADIAKRAAFKADVPSNGVQDTAAGERWSPDSQTLLAAASTRDFKTATLYRVDARAGQAKPLIRETSDTYVRMSSRGDSNIAVDDKSGDIFWFSQRDGWGHLYRYGRDGVLKNQLDKGEKPFASIIHIDGDARTVYFSAWGSDPANPYHRQLFRINFDGSGLTPLTPEPGDHEIKWSPSGGYFLDTFQSVTRPPVTVARGIDGRIVQTVSEASNAPLRAIGWRPAEQFSVKARDGKTDLYGIMYKPSHFDPAKRYPVVVNIYPGPQMGSIGNWSFQGGDNWDSEEDETLRVTHGEGMSQALAELGFIVVKVNSLGTAERSKAFEDFTYKNAIDNGLPDQVAAVRQLASRYPWLDLDRVGIFGHSGGGFATAAALLTHPDFFKVGVAEAGNHDFRTYGWYWGEKYEGMLKTSADAQGYVRQANLTYADRLKGKLLLVHGDMDCNTPPAETLRLADALVRNGKPFDLLMVPEAGHQMPPYVMRRAWDYFLTNLASAEPKRAGK